MFSVFYLYKKHVSCCHVVIAIAGAWALLVPMKTTEFLLSCSFNNSWSMDPLCYLEKVLPLVMMFLQQLEHGLYKYYRNQPPPIAMML